MKMLILFGIFALCGQLTFAQNQHNDCADKAREAAFDEAQKRGFTLAGSANEIRPPIGYDNEGNPIYLVQTYFMISLKNGEVAPSVDVNGEKLSFLVHTKRNKGQCSMKVFSQ